MSEQVRATARTYARQYREEKRTPRDVVEAALEAVKLADRGERPLDAFVRLDEDDVRRQADESTRRFEQGTPRSILDGVLIPVKDEFDVAGIPTTAGTSFRGDRPARRDSAIAERLREAGAILFGKTSMHEIGLGGTGINPGHITARNPHHLDHAPGGSSSGSAAAVTSGICPLAVGSDAGGSVRIPSAFCGIYGLKPTWGRIPTIGGAILAWSLDHLGPLGASVQDLADFYDATAGPHPCDEDSRGAPEPEPIGELDPPDVGELRIGWSPQIGADAEDAVVKAFMRALEVLEDAGAVVEERHIPHIEHARRIGYVTMGAEAAASQRDWLEHHRRDYNLDTRLLLAVGARISAEKYLHAQRVRTVVRREFGEVFAKYDLFLTPTTGMVAPRITEAALASGEVDSRVNSLVSRYTFVGNITGFPAVSIPCGVDPDGLPIGLMLHAAPWRERRLLNAAAAVDSSMPGVSRAELFFEV